MSLEPADLKRCQAETKSYVPFGFGPPHRVSRCVNKPIVVVREKKPAADGLQGSMSLCGPCLEVFNHTKGQPEVDVEYLVEKAT